MPCDWSRERHWQRCGHVRIAGIDEAGRGPLAGPVVAGAVILTPGLRCKGLDDSKKMSHDAREGWWNFLTTHAKVCYGVGLADPAEIDELNILRATHLAMRRALEALPLPAADFALIDGLPVRDFLVPHEALVKGDGRCFSIAAASIIAKVTRDRLMMEAALRYPAYGFERHKGYSTPEHLARLEACGPCAIHRHSFAPVAQMNLFSFRGQQPVTTK